MVLLVQLAQGLALGQLQEGDLGRHHPTKEVAEDGVVAKGDDILELPEDAARVAVVVVPQGDVLQALFVCLQVVLHVFEEPRLVVIADAIQLAGLCFVSHDPCHDDGLIQGVEQPFHEVILRPLGLARELLTDGFQAPHGLESKLDILLGRDNADLGSHQEAQGPAGPGHGIEQVGVF